VAAYGIATQHRLPDLPLDDTEFDQLLGECEHHRVVGFLGVAIRDRSFAVTKRQRDCVESAWQGWLSHAVRMEALLLDTTRVLEKHGIRSIALKGVALAHTEYAQPCMRVFGDIDLLVEPRNFTRAAEVLVAELEASRPLPELRRGFDDRFGKEILLRARDHEVDLHRMFVEGPYGVAVELDDLWRTPDTFTLGGRQLLALSPPARAVHAAYAAVLGDWPVRLGALRDFVQTASGNPSRLDNAIAFAGAWRCDAVVHAACAYAHELLGVDLRGASGHVVRRRRARDRVFLASYRGSGRGYLYNLLAPLAIRGFRERLRFLFSIAFPDPGYLVARGTSRRGFLRQAWRKVRLGRGSR
jgi:hypothetical protein